MIGEIEKFLAENARWSREVARSSSTAIECESGSIDYAESGQGPTVVLVPGSCSTGVAWRPVVTQWEGRFRTVTTSLLGYGGTTERRSVGDADIRYEAEVVESVIRWADGPVHLVGHSFGGLVGLAVALRNQVSLLSLSIIEAPAPEMLRIAGEDSHYRAYRDMTDAYFRAFDACDAAPIERMIDFYGGAGTFAAWPQRLRDYAVATTPVNILDWASAYGFAPKPEALAAIRAPTLVLCGAMSHPAVKRANALIAKSVPGASVAAIPGAAHFMIATHPAETARAIARHIGLTEYTRGDEVVGLSPSLT